MNVKIFASKKCVHFPRVKSVVSLINGVQRFFHLTLDEDERLSSNGSKVNPKQICESFESEWQDHNFILITEIPFDDNWFSHEYRKSGIITVSDWESIYAPPSVKAYLIYQIAQALINFSADMSEEMVLNMVHEPARGCIFDMASHKPDIKYGMISGNLCPSCSGQLRELGTYEEAISSVERILYLVRAEAIGKPIVLDPSAIFVVMRFSQNDENDNAWKYGIKLGAEKCGFTVHRADDHVESGQILKKIYRHIQKSRLVIAKVDEQNLNVYFELGLAMGLDKDVLLVSEDSLIINLPSDLRNWECLSYQQGDYEQLANRIQEFLVHTYFVNPEKSS